MLQRHKRLKRVVSVFAVILIPVFVSAIAGAHAAAPSRTHATHLVSGTSYVSLVRLQHQDDRSAQGHVLIAFEQAGRKGIPIYRSVDQGRHWTLVTHVTDQAHAGEHWQLSWQPNLTELPRASGPLPRGTLLLAGNATRFDEAGHVTAEDLELYASHDHGRSWTYRGSIIEGGGQPSQDDNKGVWEPFIRILGDGRMVAWYSSEQHKAQGYNQVLAHKVSRDGGRTWGKEVIDVAIPGGVERPGMATAAHLADGRYAMTYEDIDGPHNGQVFIKFSRNGLDWGDPSDHGQPIATQGGAWPAACPVLRWFPRGGSQGVLVVSAERAGGNGNTDGHALYWNDNGGQGPWWELPAPVQKRTGNIHAGWTQALMFRDDGKLLHITSSSSPAHPATVSDNEIVYASKGVAFNRYEAEDGARTDASAIGNAQASNGRMLRIAARPRGKVRFDIHADHSGTRLLKVRYAPMAFPATPAVSVNGARQAKGKSREDGAHWRLLTLRVPLRSGGNRITVSGGRYVLDLDYVQLQSAPTNDDKTPLR